MRFQFKKFQRQDYARLCLHDGGVLGHDTGGGKGLALFVITALKVGFERHVKKLAPLKPVLLVVPGDLHGQVILEAREKFRADVTPIETQADFLRLSAVNPAGGPRILPAGYYITSYSQLASNGMRDFPKYDPANWLALMSELGLTEDSAIHYFNHRHLFYAKLYEQLRMKDIALMANQFMLKEAWEMAVKASRNDRQTAELNGTYHTLLNFTPEKINGEFHDLTNEQQEYVLRAAVAHYWREYSGSIGQTRWLKSTALKRVDGRIGEANEFVEFQTGNVRLVAQRNPQGEWPIYRITGDQVTTEQDAFGTKTAAVAFARSVATELAEADPATQTFKVKCVYDPSLADLSQDSYEAVAVDEGVRMKGEDTEIGLGVRQMNPRYRFVLSATPIKNRLPDAFRLAWWASGAGRDAHARWPYPDSSSAREAFANEFLISERNLTKEGKSEASRRYAKLTPQVCNIHRLWKLFAPVILRRRKRDFGEDIVAKTRHVVRVPMGQQQAAVYKFHLDAKYTDKNGLPAIGAQLQALRVAAANPCSGLLERPAGDSKTKGEPRSFEPHIPKLHAAFKLIAQILSRGEQVVVFSAFHDSLDALSARLQEAGVKHCCLDGRTSQKKRASIASQFKWGPPKAGNRLAAPYPVMLAGVECMAEGHSFDLCNNVILLAYSWAYDKFEQAINRVHRLNSRWDVNVYPIICEGSIDRKLEALIQEKGDAAELVLDGKLMAEHSAEVNLAELLHTARAEFDGKVVVVDEKVLEKEWPTLRTQLGRAQQSWNRPWEQTKVVEVAATVTTTSAPTAEVVETEVVVNLTPEPTAPVVSMPRPALPRPKPALAGKGSGVGFEGLALWKQSSGGLPKRPLPFTKKAAA